MQSESNDIYKRIKDTSKHISYVIGRDTVVDELKFPVMITGKVNGKEQKFEGGILRIYVDDGFCWDSYIFDIELNQNISSNTCENLDGMKIWEKGNRDIWVYGRITKILNEELWNERREVQKKEVNEAYERERAYFVGKRVKDDCISRNGTVIIRKGEEITEEIFQKAKKEGLIWPFHV